MRRVRGARPLARPQIEEIRRSERSLGRLAADRDDPRAGEGRAGAAARLRQRRLASPRSLARTPRLDGRDVRVESRRPAADRVDPAACGDHREVLAGCRPDDLAPAAAAWIELERVPREPAAANAADDVEPPGDDGRAGRRARLGETLE